MFRKFSTYTPPTPVGYYHPQLAVPARKMKIVDRVLLDLSSRVGEEPPKRGTISGTTSVFRWGPKDILISERLLNEADDDLISKVTAHEWFHSRQSKKWKFMPWHYMREAEAEKRAILYQKEGKFEDIPPPLIFNPFEAFKTESLVQSWRNDRALGKASGYDYAPMSRYSCFIMRYETSCIKPRCGCASHSSHNYADSI